MIQQFYQRHPSAVTNATRSSIVVWLICVWSARLTHSYFRREEWQFGAREDWRFTDMSRKVGKEPRAELHSALTCLTPQRVASQVMLRNCVRHLCPPALC
jgi:steroid 5-alpha reductase family enzyme